MSAEGLDMDAIRARADAAQDGREPSHFSSAEVLTLLDHVRALEQENAGLRGEVERLAVEADQAIAQADDWSGTAAVLERERDEARAALDGLRAAITVVIGPEGDEWRWSDSNLRARLRSVLGEHGGAEGLVAAPEGDSGGLRDVGADGGEG